MRASRLRSSWTSALFITTDYADYTDFCYDESNFSREVAAMKFPGGFNMQQMMKQAQQMQEKMQKEMEELVVDATAGGGVVTVQMRGTKEVESIKIDPEAVKDGDVE